jgi:hypothetical protein
MRQIIRTWWPLAASWLLMGIELPALSAVVARLAEPEINLAAYGGIVFPLALIIESPVIMLLAASTALSKDWASFVKIRRFMMIISAALTALHFLVAFTPLYDILVVGIMRPPPEIVEPARIGLMIMLPWTWSIAYRRFHQGVLIRFNHSRAVGVGTLVRLSADALVLGIGYLHGGIAGIVVGAGAVAAGVVCEAAYIGWVTRPVLQQELKPQSPIQPPLTLPVFLRFYIPLALTSLITLITNPLGSAALGRMPEALASLAVWPVISGLVFMLRALGMAYNEVVVALLDRPYAVPNLRRFTIILSAATSATLLLLAATPLAGLWFEVLSALPPNLADMARLGVWIAIPLPALTVLQSWFQGVMLNDRRTVGITESVVIFLIVTAAVLFTGVVALDVTGLYVGLAALVIGSAAQTGWLWFRSRRSVANVVARDIPNTL